MTTNDDWDCLCAIYADEDEKSQEEGQHDERKVKLVASLFPNDGFCGTAYITLSSNKVAFARLVNNDGGFRYFTIALPPIIKCDFLYFSRNNNNNSNSNNSSTDEQGGPSNLRLIWEYYPLEWPVSDKEKYRSSLAKKCNTILQEDFMSFSVIEFLENNAMSFYYKASDTVSGCNNDASCFPTATTNTANTSNSWKTYVDRHLPDYQLVILPPEMDLMHYKTQGILLHPQKEAAKLEKASTKKEISGKKKDKEKKKTSKIMNFDRSKITSTLEFGRHALIQNWKDLYKTTCPICLDDSALYSDGIVLPYCQHYVCRDCFDMYLKFKVDDLKQHRTNPFVCPVESCKRELPILSYCKQFLSGEDMDKVKAWYRDLCNPPAWSLDRCLATKSCGALGSMRRRKGVVDTGGKAKATKSLSSKLEYLVYCDNCNKTWCELCLSRVYEDNTTYCIKSNSKTNRQVQETIEQNRISNHRLNCKPQGILKFCRRYMAAPKHQQEACETKYPWMVSYTQFCQHDGAALQYILENGQRCPNCQTGVERSEGCFHMKCFNCATHFCYECGMELFPPFYGTHHCWEEREEEDEEYIVDTTDEQLAMALQYLD